MSESIDRKYELYEASVQDPETDLGFYDQVFVEHYGRKAMSLREDFCGSFWTASTWVASHPERTAIAIDFAELPLDYGRRKRLEHMGS